MKNRMFSETENYMLHTVTTMENGYTCTTTIIKKCATCGYFYKGQCVVNPPKNSLFVRKFPLIDRDDRCGAWSQ